MFGGCGASGGVVEVEEPATPTAAGPFGRERWGADAAGFRGEKGGAVWVGDLDFEELAVVRAAVESCGFRRVDGRFAEHQVQDGTGIRYSGLGGRRGGSGVGHWGTGPAFCGR